MGFVLSGFLIPLAPAKGETQKGRNPLYTIAFTSLVPWDLDVFLAHADGSEPAPLLSHPALDYNAAFLPDGKCVVFTSHRAGNADLYRARLDGSGLERLTDHPAFDDAAAFSPDSQRMAFVSSRSGQADIWVRDLESRKTWNVTDAPGGTFAQRGRRTVSGSPSLPIAVCGGRAIFTSSALMGGYGLWLH